MRKSFMELLRSGGATPADIDKYIQLWHNEGQSEIGKLEEYLGMSWEEFSRYTAAGRLVPKGHYCYDGKGVCPFWQIDKTRPHQENGYCSFLKKGDWEFDGFGLLWDQCKECSLEPYDPDEEIITMTMEDPTTKEKSND